MGGATLFRDARVQEWRNGLACYPGHLCFRIGHTTKWKEWLSHIYELLIVNKGAHYMYLLVPT